MTKGIHNHQKKIAVINDFCGFGRCSTAVALPIISQMKIQCCPLPTSVFSNHTGYPSYFFDDYTDKMQSYITEWKRLRLKFDGILSGFLSSQKQIEIVKKFIRDFSTPETTIIIDPVMGDNGKAYTTFSTDFCEQMKELVSFANILTPNLTEACILTDTEYKGQSFSNKELFDIAVKLSCFGDSKVVISGIEKGAFLGNVVYEPGFEPHMYKQKKSGATRAGTGDVFASVIAGDIINGADFTSAVKKAAGFVKKAIAATEKYHLPKADGTCFEDVLYTLK